VPFISKFLHTLSFSTRFYNRLKEEKEIKFKIISLFVFCILIQDCNKNPAALPAALNDGVGTWIKIKSGVSVWLYDVDFSDERNGWVVGDSGVIINSKNGGETWQGQMCPIEESLWAVDFVDSRNGWICSWHSILKTTDGGENWELKYSEDLGEGRFRDIQFLNRNIGFVVGGRGSFGSTGVLLKTEDGGETWSDAIPHGLSTLTHISIVDRQNIWICGFGGNVLLTMDIGLTWEKRNLNISPAPSLTTIQFVDQNNGWVGSRDDCLGFYRTTDSGSIWVQRSPESWPIFLGVKIFFFVDTLNGWLGTFPGAGPSAIIQTRDGGKTWKFLQEDMNVYNINSFYFINNDLGWAVGLEEINTEAEGVILLYRGVK